MTEMTAQEAQELLKHNKLAVVWNTDGAYFTTGWHEKSVYKVQQIAALIEQQAAEIAKRDRMLNKACKRLSMTNMSIRTEKQWLAWLEKEAQGVE